MGSQDPVGYFFVTHEILPTLNEILPNLLPLVGGASPQNFLSSVNRA